MKKDSFKAELKKTKLIKDGILGYAFNTEHNKYFYDIISSKILKVKDILFHTLKALCKPDEEKRIEKVLELSNKYSQEQIVDCLAEIRNSKEKKGLFRNITDNFKITLRDIGGDCPNYNQIVLEVTKNCNFRCSYCAFTEGNYKYERSHTKKNMAKETAFKALDFFFENVNKDFLPLVTFFGGEPLLNKALIEDCVSYAKTKNPRTQFSIQTNGYLLNKKTLEFLYSNQFQLSVSVDGPKEIHDRCRRLISGKGTYNKIMSNLEFLYGVDKDYFRKKVSISYTFGSLGHFQELINFHNNNTMLKGLKLGINHISNVGLNDDIKFSDMIKEPFKNYQEVKEMLDESFWKYIKDMSEDIRFEDLLFTRGIVNIINRRPVDGKELILNGPCRLGRFKLFVSTEGGFKVCDKTTRLPFIGDAWNGVNWKKVWEMEKDLLEHSKDCYKCWAMSLCEVCWVHLYTREPKTDLNIKRKYCNNFKAAYSESLMRYAQIIEYDPSILEKLESEYRKNQLD